EDVQALARQALTIEEHYGRPMDIEWAKDGITGKLFIVQARPETVKSRAKATQIERFMLNGRGEVVCEGRAIGQKIGTGVARVVRARAGPSLLGTANALDAIEAAATVTVSCAEGDTGVIYAGALPFERITTDLADMPEAPLKIMMNVANPERAFDFGQLPNAGIGLARLEMIIAAHIGVHPNALLEYDRQDAETRRKIDEKTAGYASPVDFYVGRLAEGTATLTASVAPHPVIVRLSDFKSNEYANLIGGS